MLEPPSSSEQGVFRDGRINSTIQISPGLTLEAMVTKIGLFSQEIGQLDSACTITTAADFAPNMGFSETADLMLPFPLADPCCHGNKIWAMFAQNRPYLGLYKCYSRRVRGFRIRII